MASTSTRFSGAQQKARADGALRAGKRAVVEFLCTSHSHADFAAVFRALHGMYIRPAELVRAREALEYFGLPADALLVAAANDGNAGTAEGEAVGADSAHNQQGRGVR